MENKENKPIEKCDCDPGYCCDLCCKCDKENKKSTLEILEIATNYILRIIWVIYMINNFYKNHVGEDISDYEVLCFVVLTVMVFRNKN